MTAGTARVPGTGTMEKKSSKASGKAVDFNLNWLFLSLRRS